MKLEAATPEYRKQLEEFLEEHGRVAAERDQYKQEAAFYASEVDERERQLSEVTGECATYKGRLQNLGRDGDGKSVAEIFKTLPTNLVEVAKAAGLAFPRLVITERAIKAAEDFWECVCVREAWEMLVHLQDCMWSLKFEADGAADWERTFREKTGYDLAMSEGKQTQNDKGLMRLRKIMHGGREYDITPHVKHGNVEPKAVRIYFAFDEGGRKIVVGHIGKHIPNYTTKNM